MNRPTIVNTAAFSAFLVCTCPAFGGVFKDHPAGSISGGSRWDAAPRMIGGLERSLNGGLRYSLQGGTFEAYRDLFSWSGSVPMVAEFQQAVEQAFAAWESIDPVTNLATDLRFVPDLGTAVVGTGSFTGVNIFGAEIDLLAMNAGDAEIQAATAFDTFSSRVRLTSGTPNYLGSSAIIGADVKMNNNPGAAYTLNVFRRVLTHELGHAIGLGDVENANASNQFLDDNYDGSTSDTARNTLTNSWALLVNTANPAASPLALYIVADADPGIRTPGVDILMESNGAGISAGNPVTALVPLTNDDYGTRQFLYPSLVPEPSTLVLLGVLLSVIGQTHRRRGK